MAYKRVHWKGRRVERPQTFFVTPNEDGSQTLTDAPGEVTQEGTPVSAENLNCAEDALQQYSVAFDTLLCIAQSHMQSMHMLTNEEIDRAILSADADAPETDATLGKMTLGIAFVG